MTPRKAVPDKVGRSDKQASGRVQFVVKDEDETLVVHLDRKGFRRLVQTLERLAEGGDPQPFDKSGRQSRKRKLAGRKDMPITRLAFTLDQGSTG